MLELQTPFRGRTYLLNGSARDRSIVGALEGTAGTWEPHIMEAMRNRISSDAICLDIGANIGIFTLYMSGLASEGHIFAFEPSFQNMRFLRENLALNNIRNVTALRNALWDRPGQIELFYLDELAGCSFIDMDGDEISALKKIRSVVTQPWMDEIQLHCSRDPVECFRLDDWVTGIGLARLDLIKLDVEGSETAVLSGALDTIGRYHPSLITEFNPVCMIRYFGRTPQEYYRLLAGTYPVVSLIESNGDLTPIPNYEWLGRRIEIGKGWEDLLCCFETHTSAR